MLGRVLDRWDEARARRGDAAKKVTDLVLDAELAFPESGRVESVADFCALADRAADPSYFGGPDVTVSDVRWDDGWIAFPSGVRTYVEPNDLVMAKVTKRRQSDRALVVFHHWNAGSRYPQLAHFLAWQGVTVVEMALPYHLERKRPGSSHADDMLSPNLGRTLRSMRQAVLDGRKLVRILHDRGYRRVSVLGMSLGSWVAGLVAANDRTVDGAALFLAAGSLADMVWTGRATRHVRAGLEGKIDLPDLRRAWAPLDLQRHVGGLTRPGLELQLVVAKRDTVVLPKLSAQLVSALREAGAAPGVRWLNCGHYSLSLPPFALQAGSSALRLCRS